MQKLPRITGKFGLGAQTQYVSKSGKFSRGHRTGKGQFSIQSQRKAMPKNVQTIIQSCSFHMLARICSKSYKLVFGSTWTENFQMHKLRFRVRGTRGQTANIPWNMNQARKFQNNIYFCIIDYAKVFDCVCHNTLKNSVKKRDGNTRPPFLPPEKPMCMSRSSS